MSEWYKSQKQSRSNFRHLLQERIDKSNPRRNLTAVEAKRLAKVREAAELGELDALIEQQAQFGSRVTQKNK